MLEESIIARSAMSLAEYREGQKLCAQNAAVIDRVDSFWRGESNVKATVRDGSDLCTVVLSIREDAVRSCSCSCTHMTARSAPSGLPGYLCGLCRHGVAAALTFRKQGVRSADVPVRTSPAARMLLHSYAERNLAGSMRLDGSRPVELKPRLRLSSREAALEFRIGREKFYIVRDLNEFAAAMENGTAVEYGKSLGFVHVPEAFSRRSADLANLIVSLVHRQADRGQRHAGPLRELILDRYTLDPVMEQLADTEVETSFFRKDAKQMPAVRGNPDITVVVRRKGKDGASVSAEGQFWVSEGIRRCYACDGEKLYLCGEEFSARAGLFLAQLFRPSGVQAALDFQAGDLTAFCGQVLPQIAGYVQVVTDGIDLAEFEPLPLRTEFYFDMPQQDQITCEVKQFYGDQAFNPVNTGLPDSIYRDLAGEMRVRRVVSAYFPFRDPDGRLVIDRDPDQVYRLLQEGLEAFQGCGTVYATDAFRSLKIRPVPKVSASVRLDAGLLDLKLEIGELEREELAGLLESYRLRRKFHRLRSGEFLPLEDDSTLSAVSELAEGIGLNEKQLSGEEISLNRYWSLYVDQTLRRDGRMQVSREEGFRKLVREISDVSSGEFAVPEDLEGVLRPYQKEGYQWLRLLDAYGFGGILADDMGLGKSLQMIAVLAQEAEKKSTSLLVCPASLIYNWQNEFEKFVPRMKVLPVAGDAAERAEALEHWKEYDVLVTSYDLLRRDLNLYADKSFRFEVLDEAQFIKNYETQNAKSVKAIRAGTRFALTGTPVENHLGELWSIFDYLMPGFLGTYPHFREHFEVPIMRESDERAFVRLQKLVGPFLLRRKKRDVLKELPDKMEHIVYSGLDGEQKRLYRAAVLHLQEQLAGTDEGSFRSAKLQILTELMRLRQLCCDPSLCFEDYQGESAKLSTCMELVESSVEGGHKVLLFSQFTSMLDRIAERLDKAGIAFHLLTGATPKEKRMAMVNSFRSDSVPVFLISLKAGGTGLNLTAADVVIHFDPWWNSAAEQQATDRAHRIGQDRTVSVYKLIARHTIEERILHLQEQKRKLADHFLEQDAVSLASLSREEILALLSESMG